MCKEQEIKDFIYRTIAQLSLDKDHDIKENDDLFSSNILDSFNVMNLIALIEEKYDIDIDYEKLTSDNIRTISGMVVIIQSIMRRS